ncbi:type I polyketide synthase [Streptomyces varsoviensis]|uniref:type I polyketide synthase n=1 Tax=Streptomyces varsoviensis TaxID=67373 RepID=UPI0012FEBBA0|nr:type I polyketide synthase [Streptomyces varsoviensis]
MSLEDAARVVALRSKALRVLSGRGGMVSVALPAGEVGEWLAGEWGGELSVAAVNGPASTVVSGDAGALDALLVRAEERGVRARRVPVDYASHCAHVEDIYEQLLSELNELTTRQADVPFYSTVTGGLLDATVLDAEYWYRNLRQTVRFEEATRALLAEGFRCFVEPSAHPVLTVGVQESAEAAGVEAVVLGTLRRDEGGRDRLLLALGQAWASGLPVDFSGTYPGARRVELPTYPFQRERFWLEAPPPAAPVASSAAAADDLFEGLEREDPARLSQTLGVSLEALGEVLPALAAWRSVRSRERRADSWRYHVGWRPVPVPIPASPGVPLTGRWLAVVPQQSEPSGPAGGHASDAVAAVLAALTAAGVGLAVVTATGPGATREELSAALSEAVSAASAASAATAATTASAVDGAGVEGGDGADKADDREPVAGVLSFLAWEERVHPEHPGLPGALALTLALAQALGDAGVEAPLWLLTSGTAVVGGAERPGAPAHAAVAALGRTVALEHPQRWGGLIDLPAAALDERAARRLCAVLAGAAAADEEQVAVRSTGVHGRRLLAAPPRPYETAGRWESGGTVLVTGGTGGVGACTARRLAEQGVERLLLVSRRGPDAPGAGELCAELAELGVEASVVACDIADREALAALVAGIPDEAPLTGVFHAAGVLDDGLLDALTPARLAVSLRAKLTAAQNLHEVTAGLDLSAFVVFSSVMGVVGNAGQGNYAAANAAMDALVALRRADGLPGTSIAWGAWAVTGMLDGEVAARLRDAGMPVMEPDTAVTAIGRAMAEDDGLVLVADVDWRRYAAGTGLRSGALLAELPDPRPGTGAGGESAATGVPGAGDGTGGQDGSVRARLAALTSAQDRIQCVTDLVRTHTAAVLRHRTADAVRPAEAFAALGLDSLTAVELRNRLGGATGLKLPATVVFDHPTPGALAERLLSELSEAVGAAVAPTEPATEDARAHARPYSSRDDDDDPIAIVGMGCRFPGGVERPEQFWDLLAEGVDAVGDWPLDRGWDTEGLYDPDPDHPGTTYSDQGAFIADVSGFDAEFFGISPREALAMDPQQRLLLETSWEAIERAGQDPSALRGRQVGVFFGTNGQDYLAQLEGSPGASEGHFLTGNTASVLSGRVSYTLGLEGPSLTLDTACSSSLVALHLAVQALRRGDCEQALAGGVTVMSTPKLFVEFSRQRGLAPDGRCKAFSADADGTGWGEGAGVLLLERLSAARRHGHPVLALVSGVAVNQDGASNGLSAPNGPAQQNVIRAALADAGLRPEQIDAVEAHGTGTTLGDPIEAQALQAVYGARRAAGRPLWLGSVKSNIGHTQAAAGVAGVMKMVLALGHGELPSTLHLGEPNPHVDWSAGTIRLLAERTPWPESDGPRRAGVSSFGISGTNAHVVLEQAPEGTDGSAGRGTPAGTEGPRPLPVPLLLSAATGPALRAQAERLHAHLAAHPDTDLADVAYSLASGRAALEHRAAVLGTEPESVLRSLRAYAEGRRPASVLTGTAGLPGRTAFLFPGQGSQRAGAGARLYRDDAVFADALDEVLTELDPHLEVPLHDVLFAENGTPEAELLERTRYTQPALFALETALFRLVRHWGVRPDLLMGHSIGELAAAHAAGVLDLRDACALVAARGRLMDALPEGGAMVAIEAEEAEVRSAVGDEQSSGLVAADIAAVNGPDSTVVSGDTEAVLRLAEAFRARGRRTKRLAVSHAFHSARMDGMLDEFRRVAEGLTYSAPRIAVVSNLTGEPATAEELCSPDYWVRHVRGTVRFLDGARRLRAEGATTFLELGPGGVLSGMLHGCLADADGCETLPVLREGRPETAAVRGALAGLHVRGVPVDWTAGWRGVDVRRVGLPTYAFQHKRFWPQPSEPAPTPVAGRASDELWDLLDGPDGVRAFAAELGLGEGATLQDVPGALASRRSRRAADAAAERLRYRVGWQPLAVPPAPDLPGTWLLVVPEDGATGSAGPGCAGLALACEEALVRHGAEVSVLRVAAGTGRAELAGLLPADRSDVVGVLSLLAFADAEAHADAHADVEDGRSAFGSDAPSAPLAATLTLIQALGDRELNAPLWCVTSGAVAPVGPDAASAHVATAPEAPVLPDGSAVGPYEPALTDSAPTDSVPIDPVQAQIWGLGRVAALELPRLWGGLIDLTGALDGGELEDGALDGMCAVLGGADGEDQVAVRGARLFGRRLDRASVPARPAAEVWKPRGTVLITGGTGGLGAHVARKLAAEGAEHLVLLSRRGPRSPGAAELTAELSALGARSTVLACDVADRAALTRVLDGLRAEQETVRAVVHTAGLTSDTRIEHCTPDGVARETAAKTRGADHLDALFDSPSLDAFVLFSSISATWGSGGQAAYAAANAHLDALAAARCARGLAATSVAWGPWSGAGMAHGDVGRRLRRHGLVPMEPAAALDALQRALTYGESELVVADMDWQGFLPAFLSARDSALLRRLPDAAPAATAGPDAEGPAESGADAHDAWRRALAELPPDERGHRLRELVRAEAAEVLGHDSTGSIDADRPFRDAGFDSLTAVELRNRLIAVTGLALPLTTVFDHPTATALGDHLLAELTVAELTGGERDGAGLASAGPQGAGSGGAARWLSTSAATPVSVDSAASAAFDAAAIPDGPDAPAAPAGEPLAIVSMACRFPGGVRSPEGLWRLVADGVDAIGDFPADRGWPLAELYDPDPERQGTFYATGGGFLDGAGEFDAEFFGVSPREALAMDPQQRLLLETGWEALERAGIDPETVRGGQGGVYIGVASQGYGTGAQDPAADVEGHLLSGTVTSVASGRISYILGLEGPAVTVETACSSSLVALHLAGQALRSGDCSFALVGGAAVMASPDVFVEFSRQQGLSPDGRCRSFAQSANGTGWGEGVGVLLVERLSDARRLGHPVLALVRGTAVNQDGASNGLTAPSGPAQQRAITAALAGAGLRPEQIDLVEAHGTGTTLGDPIEAQALLATYGQNRPQRRPLWLGSLKSNIGHTQAAAGVAGVIKTVMALRHGVLPRTLHAEEASRRVDWSTGAVRLLSDPRPWDTGDEPRRAGVSAFGMSGTNAHAILEQAPEAAPLPHHHAAPSPRGAAAAPASHGADDVDGPEAPGAGGRDALGAVTVVEAAPSAGATEEPGFTGPTGPASVGASPVPWLLSARTPGALRRQARQLAVWLEEDSGLGPADVAVALATTRTAFSCRAAAVGTGRGELLDWLGAVAEGEVLTSAGRGRGKGGRTAFVFPGQGSQWVGMGSELLGREAVFTAAIERCAAALAPHTDWSLTRVLRNEPDAPSLDRVDVVQPTLFAVMVALAEYWRAIGVRADAVVGHSQGEIAAACVAGALSLPDAAMVVALRSKALLRIAGRGGMVSVAASEERVRELLADGDGSCVAAVNGPDAVVVAGEPDGLDALLSACERDGLRARRIPVDYAAHSAQVAEIKDELLKSLAGVRPRSCVVPMYSAVTGGPIDGTLLNADYWYRNLREPVDFAGATGALLVAGHDLLIEVSPHPVLLAGAERVAEAAGRTVTGVGTLRRDDGGPDRLLASSAEAWAAGAPLDRRALLPEDAEARPVTLPTYPFQRDRYWLPTPGRSGALALAERAPATTPDLTAEATTPGLSAAANATGLTAEANATGLAATAGSADLAAASDTADLGVAAPGANASPEHASAADEADEVESPAARLAARLASLDEPGRRQAVLDLVTRHAAAVLGHPGAGAVPPDRAFSDVGFDSMLAMRFRSRLCTATGLSIPPTVVFEHPTPAALADHLHDELSAAVPAPVRLTELDDLAAKLAALTPGAPGTEEIGDRLTDLLRDWTRRVDPAGSAAANGLTGHTSPTAPNGSTAPARPTDPTGRPADAPAGHPADEAAPVAAPDPASADAMATASADELFALLDDNFGMA